MEKCILVLGEYPEVKLMIGDSLYIQKDGIAMIYPATESQRDTIISRLQNRNIQAYTLSQYNEELDKNIERKPIQSIATDKAYDWLKTGCEYFGVVASGGKFYLSKITSKGVEEVSHIENAENVIIGNTGCFFGCIKGKEVTIKLNDEVFSRILCNKNVNDIVFSFDDKYIGLQCGDTIKIYDVFRNKNLLECEGKSICFTSSGFYVDEKFYHFEENRAGCIVEKIGALGIGAVAKRAVSIDGKRCAEFVDGTPQKILYIEGGKTTHKSQANVISVDFFFTKDRLFVITEKKLEASLTYTMESFSGCNITSTILPCKPKSFSASDLGFSFIGSDNVLRFYRLDKYSYTLVSSIQKKGSGIVSMSGKILCFYDEFTGSLEFYDQFRLRSAYSLQEACSCISWSYSGLYVAVYGCDAENGVVQIFNIDGEFVSKKAYSKFQSFQWRSYIPATDKEVSEVEEQNFAEEEIATSSDSDNLFSLITQWKNYLQTKRAEHYTE